MQSSSLQWQYMKLTSHSLDMLVPGELELPLYPGLSTVQMKMRDQATCLQVMALIYVISLSFDKLNQICFTDPTVHIVFHMEPPTPKHAYCERWASAGLSDAMQ